MIRPEKEIEILTQKGMFDNSITTYNNQKILDYITDLEAKLKAAEDHAATMEACARVAEEKLKSSVPFEKVQSVIDEIWAEIKRMEGHSNIGKLGCVRRLEKLIPKP